ncbi:Chromatin structure-remodeling complex protein RSC3 [Dissostichus eleginoides]|uniref:Chromatin structure-remodeling complex protein RSC3 n=1 Tax=Dissostichus eleginoides TaxID=100907 RepID=A0AAD9CN30_DISEL|nr:Chromatin structure-remodeling complex protein RSC3 [Dissostichus eleginoides]
MTPGLCAGTDSAIDRARNVGEGSQVPPESLQTTQIYYWRGPSLAAPSHITAQTARVYWLHPNKQANTDNSLVHNTLNRHHMRTIGRSYTEEQRKIWVM